MERPKPPSEISAEEFFTTWVGHSVASDDERRQKLAETDASIVFELAGEGGGAFTVFIKDQRVTGVVGNGEDPDLRVRLDVATWRRLNSGDLSAPEAMLKRRLKLEGNFLLGLKLHLILG